MNSGPTLSIRAIGHDVQRLKRIFVMTKALAPNSITGTFDMTTEQAVKDFQQSTGLTVDGIVGPATWYALPADPNTPGLARGTSGSVVTSLQQGLKKYSTPAVHVDGIVGDQTWWVTKAAQRLR
jgi:peptidoglycan hydrolase-like protein with peptidoglycan-binding domain